MAEPHRFTDGHGLTVAAQHSFGDRLIELWLRSDSLVGTEGMRILLPAGYDPASSTRYPVLYLLHGGLGGFRDWTDVGGIEALTPDVDLIIVMPSGGTGGWYRDWHDFGRGRAPRWETFHTNELIGWVDGQLATRADASSRAIAGQSMGGFGALSYAARHPELFTAAVSFSGALNTNYPLVRSLICVSSCAHRRPPFAINRFPLVGRPDWSAHNPFDLAESLRGLHVTLTTGNGRPTRLRRAGDTRPKDLQEHQVRAMSLSLHQRLDDLGIAHTFRDYGDIGHTFENWRQAFVDELPALCETLGIAAPTVADRTVPPI